MLLLAPTLQTARLRLRPFAEEHADAFYALHSNPRVLRYWDAPPWTDRSRAQAFLAACGQMQEAGSGARLAIETLADRTFIGWCALFGWNPVYRSIGIGCCLDEHAWGQGYATEALHALLAWAFGALDLNRVGAELDTRNTASARVLDKLGFVQEGLRREDCIVAGEVSDSWIYGLLRRDWPAPAGNADAAAAALAARAPDARVSRSLSLVSLVVLRYDEAIAFYRDRLGFDLVEDTPLGAGKRWVVVRPRGPGSASVLLAKASTAEQAAVVGRQTGGRVFLFLHTDDLGRDHRRYRSLGVEFVREPADRSYGRGAVFKDLYGNLWDLVQPSDGGKHRRMLWWLNTGTGARCRFSSRSRRAAGALGRQAAAQGSDSVAAVADLGGADGAHTHHHPADRLPSDRGRVNLSSARVCGHGPCSLARAVRIPGRTRKEATGSITVSATG